MSLSSELRSKDKHGYYTSNNNTVGYSTGIHALDYANGYWMEVRDPDGTLRKVPFLGIAAGSLISIISETGGGKSTLAVQIGWNIVKPFENGYLIFIDCEKTMQPTRLAKLTNARPDEDRITLAKQDVTIEAVLNRFNEICELKEAGGKQYMYEVKDMSYDGKPFWVYAPTVFIIDSLPMFNSENYDEETMGNNIDQMKASKDITRFYTNIIDRAWKYNCIFIVINHIRPNPNVDRMNKPPRGLMMINQNTESLPRGAAPQYYSNTYFRIKTIKSSNYTIEDDGFRGYLSTISLAKSKSNSVGTSFPVVFNTQMGFDPIYSIFEFAKECGLIHGKNPYLTIGDYERKFNRKQFNSLMFADSDFRENVIRIMKPYYESLLGAKDLMDGEEEPTMLEYGSLSFE